MPPKPETLLALSHSAGSGESLGVGGIHTIGIAQQDVAVVGEEWQRLAGSDNLLGGIPSPVESGEIEVDIPHRSNAGLEPIFQNAALQRIFADEEVIGQQIVVFCGHTFILALRPHLHSPIPEDD